MAIRTENTNKHPRRLVVQVTEDHIARGQHGGSAQGCAIALAIKDRFPPSEFVSVLCHNALVGDSRYKLPKRATAFIYRFDGNRKVQPIKFLMVLA